MKRTVLGVLLLFSSASVLLAEESEHVRITQSSAEYQASFDASVAELQARGFAQGLESPSLNAITSDEGQQRLARILAEQPIQGVGFGSADLLYDVILQPGHYLRKTGATGTSGKLVTERALVAYITARIATDLRANGVKVLVISADNFLKSQPGLRARVFLAVHADGSDRPCSPGSGPSLAYGANASTFAMHAIGWGLSQALGYNYSDFHKDNYTPNEAHYYAFGYITTDLMKGLLEVGELTCPKMEELLITSADAIGSNVARGLRFVIGRN
jgi:N-acetylmuramoyl-L-alanine amidase